MYLFLQFLFPDAKPKFETNEKDESESDKPSTKYSQIIEVHTCLMYEIFLFNTECLEFFILRLTFNIP